MENTVISNVSPEDISKMFDGIGVSSENLATGDEKPSEDTKPDNFNSHLKDVVSDFDNFVKQAGDEPDVEIVDHVSTDISKAQAKPPVEQPEVKDTKKDTKSDVFSVFNDFITENILEGFDDGEPIKSIKDVKELVKGNIEQSIEKGKELGIKEFIASMPRELFLAADYALKGGTDMRSFFKAMSSVEEVKSFDITSEQGQESTVRMFLERQGLTEDEIDEEIFDLKDSGKLEAKAKVYKPKIDQLVEKEIQKKIKDQEEVAKRREEGERLYKSNIYDALKDGDLDGVKIDKKTQQFLFNGLSNSGFESITGKNTNLLGALLEKIQFTEPNYKLLAEATWLLADPKAYKNAIRTEIKNDTVAETVRKIKDANSTSKSGSQDPEATEPRKFQIKRNGFFNQL